MPAVPAVATFLGSIGGALGASGVMATVIGGAIVGAAVGAVVAAVTGGDILKGALMGGLVGGVGGALLGAAPATGVTASGLWSGGDAAALAAAEANAGLGVTTATSTVVPSTTTGLTGMQSMGVKAVEGAASAYMDSQSEDYKLEIDAANRAEDAAIRNTPIPDVSVGTAVVDNTSVDPRARYDASMKELASIVSAPTIADVAVTKPSISTSGALDVA